MEKRLLANKNKELPIVPPGAKINYPGYGEGQVIAIDVCFPKSKAKCMRLPYLNGIPDELSLYDDGKTILHERFGEGEIYSYVVAFKNCIIPLSYPKAFNDENISIL